MTYTVVTVPVIDTGLGVSLGYESDRAFIEAEQAKWEKASPLVREARDRIAAAEERAFLLGQPPGAPPHR